MADDEPLKWEMELDAKLDGPKESVPVLERLEATLKKLDSSLDTNAKKTKQDGDEHEKTGKKAKTLAGELEHLNKKLKELSAFEVFEWGFDKALELAKELAHVVLEIGQEAIKTAAHEERLTRSFELQLGKESAGEVLEYLDMLGKKTEFVDDQTKGFGQSLIKAGFAVKDLPHAMAAIGDLAAFSTDKMEGASAALEALTRIQRTGVVDNRSLKPFGIGEDQLIKSLQARGQKGDVESVKKLLTDGKIDRHELLQAVYQTITTKTGKLLGGAGAEMGQTLEARMQRIKNLPEQYFEKWSTSPGFQVFSDRIEQLFQKLDPESPDGKRIFAALDGALNKMTDVIDKLLTPEGLDSFVEGLKSAFEVVGSLISGLKEMIGLLNGETLSKYFSRGDEGDIKVRNLEDLRKAGYADDTGISKSIENMSPSEREDLVREGKKSGYDYGRFMPKRAERTLDGTGLAGKATEFSGIVGLDTLDTSKESGKAVAGAHLEGVKEGLDAHSPSRKMAELGRFAAAGFADGVEAGAGSVRGALDEHLGIPTASMQQGGGGGRGGVVITIPIQVDMHGGGGGDSADALAQRLVEIVPSSLQSALEQLALELGAGGE